MEISPIEYINEIKPLLPQLINATNLLLHSQNEKMTMELKDTIIYGFFIGFFLSKKNIALYDEKYKEIAETYINCRNNNINIDNDQKFLEELNTCLCMTITSYDYNQFQLNNNDGKDSFSFIHSENDYPVEELNPVIELKQCKICLEEYNIFDELNYSLNCGCIIHYSCFDNHVSIAVKNNQIPIKCPICNLEVSVNHIQDSLGQSNPNLLQKYHKFTLNNFAIVNSKDFTCCPTPGCEFLFCFNQEVNYFKCDLCHKGYCLNCRVDWHEKLTCKQFQDLKNVKVLDKQFFLFVKGMNFKQCPQCAMWVEKKEGCNHMTCRCKKEFCYKCGSNYTSSHKC